MATEYISITKLITFFGILLGASILVYYTLMYFSKDENIRIAIIVLLISISGLIYYLSQCLNKEGFIDVPTKKMAKLPRSKDFGINPITMPGAVSRDSTETLASFKDIAELLDTMNTYNMLYEKFLINITKNTEFALLHTKSIAYSIKLQAQIDTGKIVDKADCIRKETFKYNRAIKNLRMNEPLYKAENKKRAKNVTNNLIEDNSPVTLNDLTYAIERTKNEQRRIDDIRSESTDFRQRSIVLEKIRLDLQEIHNKIIRKDIDESKIPVCKNELKKFLINVEDPTSKIEPLPSLKPATICDLDRNNKPYVRKQKPIHMSNLKSQFQENYEDIEIVSQLNDIEEFSGLEEGFSDMEAQEYADSLIKQQYDNDIKKYEGKEEYEKNKGYVGDDEIFTPSNKLDSYSEITNDVKEGFANYKDIEDDDDEVKSYRKSKEYTNNLKKLRSSVRDLSWDVSIGVAYDPNVTFQRKISKQLKNISDDIESGNLNRLQTKAKMMELEILKQQLETYNRRNMAASLDIIQPINNLNNQGSADTSDNMILKDRNHSSNIEYEKKYAPGDEQSPVRQEILTNIERPFVSNDHLIRPGYEMTDDEISHRGSRAVFDETKVGGADYKKMAKFLCSQIKSADLGDPKEFGCIVNQETDVGPEYSWKGNYKMICSRLGNTWGSWYPEMFGCPKQDVAHNQIPKINRDCSPSTIRPQEPTHTPMCKVVETPSINISKNIKKITESIHESKPTIDESSSSRCNK